MSLRIDGVHHHRRLKVLIPAICLGITFTVLLLTAVDRVELKDADGWACADAQPGKCSRSKPWKWGLTSSFAHIYSYRLLGSAVLAIQMFLFALFFGLAVFLSLNAQKARGHPAGPIFFFVHDLGLFLCYGCLYVALVYFMFAVEALVHVKFPSYKPGKYWTDLPDGFVVGPGSALVQEDERQNPPFSRFLAILTWFNMSVAMLTLLFFATVAKIPMLLSTTSSTTSKQPPAQELPPVEA